MPRSWQSWLSPLSATWPYVILYTPTRWPDWGGLRRLSLLYGWWPSSVRYLSPYTRGSSTSSTQRTPEVIYLVNPSLSPLFVPCWTRISQLNGRSSKWLLLSFSSYPWASSVSFTFGSVSVSGARLLAEVATFNKVSFIIQTNPDSARQGRTSFACSVSFSPLQMNNFVFFSFHHHSIKGSSKAT